MAAESGGNVSNQFGPRDSGGIDSDLVCARQQQRAGIIGRADAAADSQWHEADFGRAADNVDDRVTPFMAGPDIKETQLIGSRRVISPRRFDGITSVAQVHEVDTLDDAAVRHIEAGDDANADGHTDAATANAVARSSRPS